MKKCRIGDLAWGVTSGALFEVIEPISQGQQYTDTEGRKRNACAGADWLVRSVFGEKTMILASGVAIQSALSSARDSQLKPIRPGDETTLHHEKDLGVPA